MNVETMGNIAEVLTWVFGVMTVLVPIGFWIWNRNDSRKLAESRTKKTGSQQSV